ncbi:MAG: hypothetical protein JWM02_3124 [Frankiales bacterium]|nr:hypothetical protein [Frankiales bacterium]
MTSSPAAAPPHFEIHIDHKPHRVNEAELTGAALRALSEPPIGADRDLWLEVPGHPDQLVADNESIAMRNGLHVFSAPRTITPGGHGSGAAAA